ncbi:spermatogenesis-associated serine-rich protein 2 [Alosa pseudoharengus]|uniref:spermatogenesis-associated serine-rich protein 2 n=1 Tax=Alosa pseudoharengus TaxID=34774 RepID=UPI003F8CA267
MARKNIPKDTSGVVFDTHSKMVMSQGGTFDRMKEKINAVRAVVPNKSNNEIALVLQHFENCVDRAVHAFVEGSAVEILKEWNVTGKKKPKKKKKPKPQVKEADPEPEPTPSESTLLPEEPDAHNGFHANGSLAAEGESLDSLSEQLDSVSLDAELDSEPATPDLPDLTAPEAEQHSLSPGLHQHGSRSNKSRPRPGSSSSSSHPNDHTGAKKIASNIDRSVKDLQRCTASLTRYRVLVKDEMDTSIKRMKQTFAELQSCLMDREVALLGEMDKVKAEAMAILDGRQKRAEELRRLTDKSASMSEDQLSELRADIKHFVSERKYDEDLGKAVKFTYELEPLKANITSFGDVYHPQTGYSSRSRCSSSSSSLIGPAVSAPSAASASAPQTQAPPPGGRPNQPHRQVYQGNRRGGQRFNGSYHDRNPGRGGYRYQGDRYQGERYHGDRHHGDGTNSAHSRGPAYSSSYSRHDGPAHPTLPAHPAHPAHNGLPQRPPRTHCP